MAKFKTIVTTVGAAKIAAVLAGTGSIVLDSKARMAVGDGNGTLPTPVPSQTALVHEVYRGALNSVSIDDSDPKNIVVELVIPPDKGGFWMREMALYDAAGTLLAVGNMAETYKPSLSEGAGRKSVIRMVIAVSDVSAVTITIDSSTVMATKEYVDDKIDEHEKSRNHPDATLTAKGFTQLNSATNSASETQAATPKAVKTVMDATNLKAPLNSPTLTGIPLAPTAAPSVNNTQIATTAFVRAAITALINASPAPLDTLGELAAAIGNDANFAVTMANALAAKAPLASPVLTGTPQAPTAAAGTSTQQLATTAFVQSAVTALINSSPAALDTLKELAAALGNDANFATTMTNALAGKQPKDTTLTNLSGKDVAALLQYLGLNRFVQSGTNANLRLVLSDNGWYVYDYDKKVNIPAAVNMGGSGALNPEDARKNFGLKGAAVLDVGTGAGTVAAGDDRRIVNAVQNTGGDINGQLRINANNNALQLQATDDNVSLFFRGVKKDGTSRWYIGSESGGDEATFYNYVFGTSLVLKASTVEINKDFYCKGSLRSARSYPNLLLTDPTLGDDVLGKTVGIETRGGSAYLYRRKGDGSSNVGQTNLTFPDVNGMLISTGNLPTAEDVGALPVGGTAKAATKLATARTIAGKSFDGTANIAIDAGDVGAYTKGESDAKYQRQTRLGAESRYGSQENYIAVPTGCVMTGLDVGGGASSETYIGYRPLQVNINGSWATINQL